MHDILSMVGALRRPRLLIRAARHGAEEYHRDRHLQRILGYGRLPRSGTALLKLLDAERDLNTQRKNEDAAYSLTRHLDILIAIMGETRILRAATPSLPT